MYRQQGRTRVAVMDAIVFDMDGTLLDSSATVPAAYAAAIFELSGRVCTDDEVIAAYGAGPAEALLGRFIGREATGDDVDCWLGHLDARLHATVAYTGIADVLLELSDREVPLAVFTGAIRRAAEMQLERCSLAHLFDAVVGSDEIAAVKPDPAGLLRACELLGVDAKSSAYVGDASNDLRCARAAGATAVAAGWGHLFEPDMEADYVAMVPADLRQLLD